MSPVVSTLGYVSTKVVSTSYEGLQLCSPLITILGSLKISKPCDHLQSGIFTVCSMNVFKQPLYIMLKYGFYKEKQWQYLIKRTCFYVQ